MKKHISAVIWAFMAVAVFAGAKPKYVFLLIGDGMSVPQRMLAEEFSLKTGGGKLAMNGMQYQISTRTKSANSIITDSAAAATAIACGQKTNNGMVGVAPDGTRLESVAEVAKKAGMKVGIMTSVTTVHATPAGFYSHRKNRGSLYQIALDLVASDFDYFAGGGVDRKHNDRKDPEYRGNVYDIARKAGYQVNTNRAEWAALKPGSKSWNVFSHIGLTYAIDADGSRPTLAEILAKGIEVLDGEKGFFIMCEGGKIDFACHGNDTGTAIREILAFDDAVKVALDFAKKHPRETLVVVTGDHETGGMSLGFAGNKQLCVELLSAQKGSVGVFGSMVKKMLKADPKISFEKIKPIITQRFGLSFGKDKDNPMRVTSEEFKMLEEAFEQDRARMRKGVVDTTAYNAKRKYVFQYAVRNILAVRAGVGWSSDSHTALPTLTTSQGVNADIILGMHDNTDIAKRLKKLLSK